MLSVGVNAASAPPGVPKTAPFVWRDVASGSELLAMWHPGAWDVVRSTGTGNVCAPGVSACMHGQGAMDAPDPAALLLLACLGQVAPWYTMMQPCTVHVAMMQPCKG